MVTELAFLAITPSSNAAFEQAFAGAAGLLDAAPGHFGHRLLRSLHPEDAYLLEVQWRDLDAHVGVFERSADHEQFMAALQPFLVGEPFVLHV
ncbi:antibiotic biosynthesis monooxygenase family protein [Stenotrophomonas sp. NPDC077464]|uniref:antibiotic biosynthesis monooxygenase family protein n=1 Tax=unclassified Stenotrophomonas TaxID=196198 RepID=UPI0037D324B2